jgi:hypothetical protein
MSDSSDLIVLFNFKSINKQNYEQVVENMVNCLFLNVLFGE